MSTRGSSARRGRFGVILVVLAVVAVTMAIMPVAAGQVTTATLNVTLNPIINDNGGTRGPVDFLIGVYQVTPSLVLVDSFTGDLALAPGRAVSITAGAGRLYVVGVTLGGYGAAYSGSCSPSNPVAGRVYNCTLTIDDVPPELTLVKEVINDSGGAATAEDWLLTATGPTTISGDGTAYSGPGGVANPTSTFLAGNYTLTESGPDGYTASSWDCGDANLAGNVLSLGVGEVVTCTITNDDIALGNIVVHKVTDPTGSGQSFMFDPSWGDNFSLKDGESHDSGLLPAGLYSVAEVVPPGWSLDDAVCLAGSNLADAEGLFGIAALFDEVVFQIGFPPSSIRLVGGQTVNCWFYNEAHGRIIVRKGVSPVDAPTASFSFDGSWADFSLAGGEFHDSGLLVPGLYSVAEVLPLGEGWSLASAFCDDGSSPAAIGVSPGETVTCTFNNRYQPPEQPPTGSLTILKMTSPAGGTGFAFDGTLGGFTLDHGGSQLFDGLAAGEYAVTETPAAGWEFEGVTCETVPGALVDYEVVGSGVVVNLAEGQDVTCKFANRGEDTSGPDGSLTIIKQTVPAGGTGFSFDAGALGAFSLDDGGSQVFTDLAAGEYVVTESPSADWEFASVSCEALDWEVDGASVTVNLAEGEAAVCTFSNGELPYTGSSAWLPVLLGGLATVLLGLGVWVSGLMRGAKA